MRKSATLNSIDQYQISYIKKVLEIRIHQVPEQCTTLKTVGTQQQVEGHLLPNSIVMSLEENELKEMVIEMRSL